MKKIALLIVFIICNLLLAFPAFSAMSDGEFVDLCRTGSVQQVEKAIKAGANLNAKDKDGLMPLMIAAAFNKDPEVVKAILKAGVNVNAKASLNTTALMVAAGWNKNPDVVKELIKAGADVNAKAKLGETALMFAAWKNKNSEVITALIKSGADINARDIEGQTALDHAKRSNNTAAIKYLETLGITNIMSDSDFIKLSCSGSAKYIEKAIKNGANVNAKDDHGQTALIFAVQRQNPEIVTTLIKAGADINAKTEISFTALMYAVRRKNFEIITMLIKAGADLNAKNKNGKTALDYINELNNPEIMYQVGINFATGNGVKEDQWEAVKWLRRAAELGHTDARNELAKRGIYE